MNTSYFKQNQPNDEKMNATIMDELKKDLAKEKILSCLVLKNNSLLFEYYKNNKVSNSIQKLNSCTKSVISVLIGTLVDQGLINVNTPITDFFSDIINKQTDERLAKITIYHLLTMSPGFDWPEFGEWNCFAPMVYSNNIIKFIFERPIIAEPGQAMNYNSGCSHLLSAIIQKITGMSTYNYANEVLFKPLEIHKTTWYESGGISLGADGLRMTSYDMLKFGNLLLNNGYYNGKKIISSEWIKESTTPLYKTYEDIGYYAYHWWVSSFNDAIEIKYYFALGYGGQYIIVVPQYDLVVIFTSSIYNNSLRPMYYFKEYILKAIES